jgi:hypothetical protein
MCGTATLVAVLGPAVTAVARTAVARTGRGTPRSAPTQAQIAKALRAAESSTFLWATVNVCVPNPHHGGLIGVRGEMPALGFPATLSMTIQLNQRSNKSGTYSAVPGSTATRTVTVGTYANHVHQDGAEFPFTSDTSRLNATVTFTWSRGSTQLGQVAQTTTGGHPQADFGQPPNHSSATCKF